MEAHDTVGVCPLESGRVKRLFAGDNSQFATDNIVFATDNSQFATDNLFFALDNSFLLI